MGKVYTRFETETAQKAYGTTYMTYLREYPPPPPRPDFLVKEVPLTFLTVEFLFILTQELCEGRNTTICTDADTQATNNNQTVAMCNTMCPMGNGTNNPMPMSPTSTMTMTTMMTSSVSTTATTTTAAAEKLCPTSFGVLFIILFTILRQ